MDRVQRLRLIIQTAIAIFDLFPGLPRIVRRGVVRRVRSATVSTGASSASNLGSIPSGFNAINFFAARGGGAAGGTVGGRSRALVAGEMTGRPFSAILEHTAKSICTALLNCELITLACFALFVLCSSSSSRPADSSLLAQRTLWSRLCRHHRPCVRCGESCADPWLCAGPCLPLQSHRCDHCSRPAPATATRHCRFCPRSLAARLRAAVLRVCEK